MPTGGSVNPGDAPQEEDLFDLIGHVIDEKISIKSVVGMGGFSIVYEGWHHVFDERVAIKCLKVPAGLSKTQTSEYFASFRREGQLLLKLAKATHNVVRIYNMGEITRAGMPSVPYLVLEWLDGEGLDGWFARQRRGGVRRLSLLETTTLLDAGAEALAKAHAMGVAHRDVKPPNFHVTGQSVKLIDFGIAKQFDITASRVETQIGAGPAYTPAYGAPEQFARDLERGRAELPATGPHTDVFALALVCVELLTGAAPLGDDESRIALYGEATRRDRRPTPRTRGAEISNEVEAVFQRALAVDITERHATVADFWRALHEAAGLALPVWLEPRTSTAPRPAQPSAPVPELPSAPPRASARRERPSAPIPQLAPAHAALRAPTPPPPPPAPVPAVVGTRTVPVARPRRWPWVVGVLAVLGLGGGLVAAFSKQHEPAKIPAAKRDGGRASPASSRSGAWHASSASRRAQSCDGDSACSNGKHCCLGTCRECCTDALDHCPPGSTCSVADGYTCVLP